MPTTLESLQSTLAAIAKDVSATPSFFSFRKTATVLGDEDSKNLASKRKDGFVARIDALTEEAAKHRAQLMKDYKQQPSAFGEHAQQQEDKDEDNKAIEAKITELTSKLQSLRTPDSKKNGQDQDQDQDQITTIEKKRADLNQILGLTNFIATVAAYKEQLQAETAFTISTALGDVDAKHAGLFQKIGGGLRNHPYLTTAGVALLIGASIAVLSFPTTAALYSTVIAPLGAFFASFAGVPSVAVAILSVLALMAASVLLLGMIRTLKTDANFTNTKLVANDDEYKGFTPGKTASYYASRFWGMIIGAANVLKKEAMGSDVNIEISDKLKAASTEILPKAVVAPKITGSSPERTCFGLLEGFSSSSSAA